MSNIFKYSQFILEEYDVVHDTRSKPIELGVGESISSYLMDKASWYFEDIDNITPIYRGIDGNTTSMRYHDKDGERQKLLSIDPSKHKRYSRNTDTIYIAMMDESDYWSQYPKRSNSIICSTDFDRASSYGQVYRVIPLKEHSKFALCPKYDVFVSFEHLFNKLKSLGFKFRESMPAIPELNDLVISMGGMHDDEEANRDNIAVSLDLFKSSWLDDGEDYHEENWQYADMIKDFIKNYKENIIQIGDIYEEIERHMNPKDNGFKLIEYNRSTKLPTDNEIYTDCECLLVLESEFNKLGI